MRSLQMTQEQWSIRAKEINRLFHPMASSFTLHTHSFMVMEMVMEMLLGRQTGGGGGGGGRK